MKARTEMALTWIGPAVLLIIWETLVKTEVLDFRFFLPPSDIAVTLWKMSLSGRLWEDVAASMYRLLAGFVLGGVPGVLLGIFMGLVPVVRRLLNPVLSVTYTIPKSAIFPLLMVFFGIGETSKILTQAIGMFFLVWINTMSGVLNIPQVYLDVGKNFGARGWNYYRTIALPGALPMIMAGIKLALGMGLILMVVVEMTGAEKGIGYQIWTSWQLFSMDVLYAMLVVISILGFLTSTLLDALERWLVPWRRS